MRRIYHVAPYYPPHLGGLQEAVKRLAIAQSKAGYDVTVITSNVQMSSTNRVNESPKVVRLKTLEFAHTPFMIGLLPSMLNRISKSDIVHLHYAQPYLPEMATLHNYLKKTPYIFHFHGDVLPSGRLGALLQPYKKYILPRSLNKASVVVFPSNDFRERITALYPTLKFSNTAIVPNGIILPKIKTKSRQASMQFLYVGRLAKIKNLPFIIKSFHLARQEMPELMLTIVGDGEDEVKLKALVIELGESDSIFFVGKQSQRQITELYSQSIVLLVASERESFGLSIVEAMSFGIPIIARDAPGVREIIKNGENGLISNVDNTEFAANIIRLARDISYRKKLGKNARKAAESYTIQEVVTAFNEIYENAITE